MKKTVIYSVLHLLVDGICAFAMLGYFASGSEGAILFLSYNFCAFALQMPIGASIDLLQEHSDRILWGCAATGAALTLAGAFLHPIVLGIGNALFHVGGGVEIIRTDRAEGKGGSLLGVFVAPGAFGLFLGAQAAESGLGVVFFVVCALAVAILLSLAFHMSQGGTVQNADRAVQGEAFDGFKGSSAVLTLAGCFAVVILRSYIGMAVTFSWKTTVVYGFVCTLAVVFGKMMGGILAAKFGKGKIVLVSLLIAAAGYWFSAIPFSGIAALFFFNMTMPITLHILTEKFPAYSGFAFGLLTFALFLGFLPIGLGIRVPVSGNATGMIGSIVSAVVLLLVLQNGEKERQGG